jgi:regulator of RNase E activity RraA
VIKRYLTAECIHALRFVVTPTICNALEIAMGGRAARGFTYRTIIAAPKVLPSIGGFARNARIEATAPSRRLPQDMRCTRLDYYPYVAAIDPEVPVIVVMQDGDAAPGTGSFWGEVNSAVHEGLGVSGVLTNGSVRDLGDLSSTFPILAGSVGPSHTHVRVEEFGSPVTVFGLDVMHDDLIHADRHGAVLIPLQHAHALPECINLVQRKEAPLLRAARNGVFTLAILENAMSESDEIH